jgi:hypothetical protein
VSFVMWRPCIVSHQELALAGRLRTMTWSDPGWSSMFPLDNNREAVEGSSDSVA